MKPDIAQDHFSLFGLVPAYVLDAAALDGAYREIQSRVHPDRYAAAGEAEKRASLQWTTRVNEAYRTLKDPVQRARYLLELRGVDAGFETNTTMPPAFLMRQMELREALEAAADARDLDALAQQLAGERAALQAALAVKLDAEGDNTAAAGLLRELQFLARFGEDIDNAYAALEA